MKKINKIIASLFTLAFASFSSLLSVKESPRTAKADGLNNVGTVSIEEVKVYNPFANGNDFLMLKLAGSDYPDTSTDPQEISKATLTSRGYEADFSSIRFINNSNQVVSVSDYFSVYSNQHTFPSYFSMWMNGMGGSKGAHIYSTFKIPSYALLCGDTTSETYGYYTLDKDYELYANDINYGNVANTYDWHFDAYTPSHAQITKVYTYIDSGNEFLTFELFGLGVDYPVIPGSGNYHFDFADVPSLLPNYKDKVFLYDENKNPISYDFDYICSIDLWTTFPRFTVGLTNLANAKYIKILSGISLPSYAKQQNDTTSVVYDGFVTVNDDLYLEIDPTAAHTHGTIINWLETINIVKNVSLASYKTQNPFGNLNEFHMFNFNEPTDFLGKANEKWSPNSLMPNASTHLELYNSTDTKLATSLINSELMFNYGGTNNICICLEASGTATKIILKEGLLFPSYALYSKDKTSETYGYYSLACDYTLLIDPNNTHEQAVDYEWALPKTTIEYYDEEDNKITAYTDQAVYGATYVMRAPVPKEEYYASWELLEPNTLVIDDGQFVVPFTGETIKFKAKYQMIPKCTVEYYDENNTLISEYTDQPFCGTKYTIRDSIPKDGYYDSWELIESTTLDSSDIIDGQFTVPLASETIKFKAHYELIPTCTIEYYDENNTLITEYTDHPICGSTYTIREPIPKDGCYATWELVDPTTLVINDGQFTVPLASETIQFKAHYEIIPMCTIEYYDENSQIITEYTKTVPCGHDYYLEPLVSKKGYDASWEVVDPTTLVIDDNKFFIPETVSSIKFKAHYEARTYTLTFEGYPSATKNIKFDEKIGDLPEIPEKSGKIGHWTIDGIIITSDTIYSWDDNKTAELQYVDRICVLTFNTNGGTSVENIEVLYGTKLSALPVTTKEGFYFDKWALDEAGEVKLTLDTVIEQDYVVHAFWLKECIVTFDSDGGSLVESISMGEGSILEQPLDPTREGFKFLGWTLNGQEYEFGKPITESITLKANWEKLPTEEDEDPNENKNRTALIIGVSAASTVTAGGIGLLIFLLLKKKKV